MLRNLACCLFGVMSLAGFGQSSSNTWEFKYPDDSRPGSLLNLRSLNEPIAGQTGRIRLSVDRRSFVRGDGAPIRFWPVCAYGYRLTPDQMKSNAKFLAKMGVNMVRIHASISPKGKGKAITDYDKEEIDKVQRYIAALKAEGIYVTLSPFWANGGHSGAAASWGLGYGDGEDVWGLLMFNDTMRAAYKGWIRHLYSDPNPYTGIPLAKDPAVAIAQIQNEDSLLFWTFQGIKPAQKKILSQKFGKWLINKYRSAQFPSTWKGAEQGGDDWATGTPALLDTWVLTQPQSRPMQARTSDQMAFLIDQQREFYTDITNYLHKDLGYDGLVNCSNWITADPVRMNDAERYTYTVADVEAVNRYYTGGLHKGPNSGWRIDEGDFFSDKSGLTDPRNLPFNIKQVVGHPTIITESGWVHPLSYQAEAPILAAAYESLSGIQGLYWFALDTEKYNLNATFDFVTTSDGSHPLSEWSDSVPQLLGQFPAAALIYRNNLVQRGTPVVHEERSRQNLDAREIPLIAEDPSFDPNHNGGDNRAGVSSAIGANPLAFLVGPVEVMFDGNSQRNLVADIQKFISPAGGRIKSNTGELSLSPSSGLFQLDTPMAQSIVGFLDKSGGTYQTSTLSLTSTNDYAAVTAVSMDDKPLSTSHKVLVQLGTVVRPTGWAQEPSTTIEGGKSVSGWKVVNTGKMPWQIQRIRGNLLIHNHGLTKATVLDAAGYPVSTIAAKKGSEGFYIRLPEDAMYVILE